jgi:AcrR family transcriptional regulator
MPHPRGHGTGFASRRQEILDTAAMLFSRRGYAATGIAEIEQAVGLGRGTLYYYIGSKESLLVDIQDRVLRPLLHAARQIAELDEKPTLRLRLLSEALLEMILLRLEHVWVYEHDYRYLEGENLSRFLSQRREFESVIRGLIALGMERGEFRAMDPHLATLQFLNLHNHTYQWVHPGGKWDATTLSREYFATLLGGFGMHGAGAVGVEAELAAFRARYEGPAFLTHDDTGD